MGKDGPAILFYDCAKRTPEKWASVSFITGRLFFTQQLFNAKYAKQYLP